MPAATHALPTTFPNVADTARSGATSAGLAIATNLAVLGFATLAGADMVVRQSASQPAMQISSLSVAVTILVPVLAGTLLLIPARRWGARGWRALSTAGLALGVLSVVLPLVMEAEPGTRLALASMHVIAGVSWFLVVRRAANRFWGV
jgi:Family of unknown function (DUF6069)